MKNVKHLGSHVCRLRRVSQYSVLAAILLLCIFPGNTSYAGSGTWILNPVNGDWNTAGNWSSNTVPNGLDTATFGVSNQTDISFSAGTSVGTIVFNPGASSYDITCPADQLFTLNYGISNASSVSQNFAATAGEVGSGGIIQFVLAATAGSVTTFTQEGATLAAGAGGITQFVDQASAESAELINGGGTVAGDGGGQTQFYNGSSADAATITNKAGLAVGASGGVTFFALQNPSAGDAVITSEGATISGASGGVTMFQDGSSASNAILIASGGSNGGDGGSILFEDASTGRTARVEVFGNGRLDISAHKATALTVGSLEGNGDVFLGSRGLVISNNSLDTTFSGLIENTGSLTKSGTGVFTLTGANTYTGGTTITAGTLVVNSASGSGTGTGAVEVDSGTLGGSGIISGAVTVGTGSGTGVFLAPAHGTKKQATLTIQNTLTFKADSTYTYTFRARGQKARSDKVIANGVTINSGGTLAFQGTVQGTLPQGTVLTAISNTSATPISGTFSNVADGAILTVNGNNFQADYQGGDGNDLTFTVVP
jgi:fibronectin-binding autotransporter adhesin